MSNRSLYLKHSFLPLNTIFSPCCLYSVFPLRDTFQIQDGYKNKSYYSPGNETGYQDYVDKMSNVNLQCLISFLMESGMGDVDL